jgi:hypothetical protein
VTAKKFKKELDIYTEISGSLISLTKSKIYGWNITPREMLEISRILGMEGCTNWDEFKYLGVPIFKSTPKASHWNQLIERIKNRINSWGANWLNLAGKVVLIKAVLASIPIYQSSLLLAPSTVIQKDRSDDQAISVGGREANGKEAASYKLGENLQALSRRGPPVQRPPNPKLSPGGKDLMEYNHRETHLEQKSPLEEILSRTKEKMPRKASKSGERLPDLHPLPESSCSSSTPKSLGFQEMGKISASGMTQSWENHPLSAQQDLRRLRDWMQTQNLYSLWDISCWGNDENQLLVKLGNYKPSPRPGRRMVHLKELVAREIPFTEKEKRQERLGPSCWTIHYSSRVFPYRFNPPCSSRPCNMESHLDIEVYPEDRYVYLDSGT